MATFPVLVPQAASVGHCLQILFAVVGALIVVVADSLARAFAIVRTAGLVRDRAGIKDPKDAGRDARGVGRRLTIGSRMYSRAAVACAFAIALRRQLESFQPAATPGRLLRNVGDWNGSAGDGTSRS